MTTRRGKELDTLTKQRRAKNRIIRLINESRNMVEDEDASRIVIIYLTDIFESLNLKEIYED